MNEPADTPTNKIRLKWILLIIALFFISPIIFFFAASALVNRQRIPPDLEKTPAQMEALHARAIEEAQKRPAVAYFPIAHETSGKTYEEFLQHEKSARPDLNSVDLYNEILKRTSSSNAVNESQNFDKFSSSQGLADQRGWQPGKPLNATAATWLKNNPGLVDLYLRFGESSGLPVRTLAQFSASFDPTSAAIPAVAIIYGVRILAAEGQRRLESGDAAGADRCWRAGARIALNIGAEPYDTAKLFGGNGLSSVVGALGNWIAANGASSDQLVYWRATLARTHADVFPPNWYATWLRVAYPAMRKNSLATIKNLPWNTREYGYDVDDRQKFSYYHTDFLMFNDMPRYDRILDTSLRSIKYKRETPRLIAELDAFYAEVNRFAELNWPETLRAGELAVPKDNPFFNYQRGDWVRNIKITYLTHETELNLLRALIEIKSGPLPSFSNAIGYESPWRDPFTETPFSMSTKDNDTLIYSLGPDGIDQLGAVKYDPTNGTMSPGDLVLSIGKKK